MGRTPGSKNRKKANSSSSPLRGSGEPSSGRVPHLGKRGHEDEAEGSALALVHDSCGSFLFFVLVYPLRNRLIFPLEVQTRLGARVPEFFHLIVKGSPNGSFAVRTVMEDGMLFLSSGWVIFTQIYKIQQGFHLLCEYNGNDGLFITIFDTSCCEVPPIPYEDVGVPLEKNPVKLEN
ncbi:hypothetical protein ACUV84_032187 [Puccinellia chinampoensis]